MILKFIIPFLGLGLVIAFHEFGHLVVAKLFKIKVEVFSIGIGKKLFSLKRRGTEYALSIIPLGGYCKLKGGDIQNINRDEDSMDVAHPLKKVLIYMAGPVFNGIIAIIIMIIFYLIPAHEITPSTVIPVLNGDYPAEIAGIKKGDKILSIGNREIDTFDDISKGLKSNKPLPVKVLRNSSELTLTIVPKNIDGRAFIGVYPFIPTTVVKTEIFSKLEVGDKIVSIDGKDVDNYYDLLQIVDKRDSFDITVIRDNESLILTYSYRELLNTTFTQIKKYNFFQSVKNGTRDTYLMLEQIVSLFINLFRTGEIKSKISSPIGLVYEVGNSIDSVYSVQNKLFTLQIILSIIASISLTLGFINLLPIPILDGGQILMNFIIFIKGSSLNPSIVYAYQTVGLVIVLLLFILGINNDIFSILENN